MQFLVNHISTIITNYSGTVPLPIFLKEYYRKHPKLGSRDRKALSEAAFIYYRFAPFLGKEKSPIEVIARALAESGTNVNPFLQKVFSVIEVNEHSLKLPITTLKVDMPELSAGIDREEWLLSMLKQPNLFIRLRNDYKKSLDALALQGVAFAIVDDDSNSSLCVGLANGTAVEKILSEEDYVVQDWASQQSVKMVLSHNATSVETVWDVCSGAGGKSLFIKDTQKNVRLLSSDIRKTILHNLALRFKQYSLSKPEILVLDSTNAESIAKQLQQRKFDLIICDVPCSGSGTWARTPEQFHFFNISQLQKFKELQYPIAFNAQQYLKENGVFAYITCSVFKAENEDVVAQLLTNSNLQVIEQQLINGIESKADSMFCTIFKKH